MNKFTKALLLSLFFAAPVTICAPAVQANTVENQSQQVAGDTTKKLIAKEGFDSVYVRRNRTRR